MHINAIQDIINRTDRREEVIIEVLKSLNSDKTVFHTATDLRIAEGATLEMCIPADEKGKLVYKRVSTDLVVAITTQKSTA